MLDLHPDGNLYLLHASWKDNSNNYYEHCVRVSRKASPELMMLDFAREQKEWATTTDPFKVGWINGGFPRVTVFRIAEEYPEAMWPQFREDLQERRRQELEIEERERDLQTIRDLVKKHGMNGLEVLALAAAE